jgi:hypothetical protein
MIQALSGQEGACATFFCSGIGSARVTGHDSAAVIAAIAPAAEAFFTLLSLPQGPPVAHPLFPI